MAYSGRNSWAFRMCLRNAIIRSGHGRLGGSFHSPEIVGIAFGMTFALNSWLFFMNKRQPGAKLGEIFSKLEKFHVPELLLLLLIWLTESRGPLMSLAAGILILQITRVKYTKLATGLVVVLLILAALGAKQYFARITDVSDLSQISEQASSAMYRRVMNQVYPEIAEKGGWFGYGVTGVPHVGGMNSIDNHFLLVYLIQGKLGYILIMLICAESIRTAIARLWRFQASEDRAFACSMLAALAIFWITLYTVFMGATVATICIPADRLGPIFGGRNYFFCTCCGSRSTSQVPLPADIQVVNAGTHGRSGVL